MSKRYHSSTGPDLFTHVISMSTGVMIQGAAIALAGEYLLGNSNIMAFGILASVGGAAMFVVALCLAFIPR